MSFDFSIAFSLCLEKEISAYIISIWPSLALLLRSYKFSLARRLNSHSNTLVFNPAKFPSTPKTLKHMNNNIAFSTLKCQH